MCLPKKMCYAVIMICGFLLAVFGLLTFIMAIVLSVNSDKLMSIFELDGMSGTLKGML